MNTNPRAIAVPSLTALVAIITLAGCNLPVATGPSPTPSLDTSTPLPALASPTSLPPAPTPPAPTVSPTPSLLRISFPTGATAGVEQGTLQAGGIQAFVLAASQTQPMIVMVDSPAHDLTADIIGQNTGNTLLPASQKESTWEGILPATQDYLITVHGGASEEAFTLTVDIPSRITFAPQATSAKVSGSTPGGLVVSYVIYALAGQTMAVSLTAPSGAAALTIYGFEDGQPLLRSIYNATTWSDTLPVTEDYIIQIVPNAGQVVAYTMTVGVQ